MRLFVVLIALCLLDCAGRSPSGPSMEFRDSDLELFDDAVDVIESPGRVEEMRKILERRVARADLIAIIRVESLSSDLIRRRSGYRLAVRIEDRLKGGSPRELTLRVDDDEPGYRTVRAHEERLLGQPFIAFVKWEGDAGSSERLGHWHLSPATESSREEVRAILRK